MSKKFAQFAGIIVLLAACSGEPSNGGDVSTETESDIGDIKDTNDVPDTSDTNPWECTCYDNEECVGEGDDAYCQCKSGYHNPDDAGCVPNCSDLDDCSSHGECTVNDAGVAGCQCDIANNWGGVRCDSCLGNWDIETDCTECKDGYFLDGVTCSPIPETESVLKLVERR